MILGFVYGFLVTLFTGYFAVSCIEREMELRFRLLFSIPLGFGISSILYFLCLYFNVNSFKTFGILEAILMVVLALLYYNEEKPDMSKHKFKKLSSWFYLLNLYAVLIFLKYFINNPMGSWDGFRIWNIKALFLSTNLPSWQDVFSLPHFMSHNDYPLMLPSLTARLWNYTGGENYAVNITIAMFFTFGLVYLLFQALEYFKSAKIAVVVTSVFMILDIFLVNGAAQCADIPLAYMFLSSIVCLFLYFRKEKFSYILLSEIFAALGAWTKNEGMMFFLIWLAVILGWMLYKKMYKKAGLTLLTAVVSVCFIAWFKYLAHTPNDLVAGFFILKTYHFAFDWSRYAIILKTFVSMAFIRFLLVFALALLCIKGFRIKQINKTPFMLSCAILLLCTAGYFGVYLFSPHDITWLVQNSMDRIILQILPVFLCLFAVNLRIGKPDSRN